ncbi:LysR family transcriptional regulator [Peribacillus butanolivorans]|uniref:LysR family transcriptional regulator n=1 Tax=Peribacillus butanolivorans TaxID=421767 RepID=UPI0036CB6CFA
MRIDQLLYITEIAKTGSIANTAERLYVSSPTISQAIRSLEEELGAKIFERSRTGLEPTATGKKIIIIAQEIINRIEDLKNAAKSDSAEIEGHLTISAVSSFCKEIIPKTCAVIKAKFPKITLEINENKANKVRKDVLNGNADFGINFYPLSTQEENQLFTTTHLIDSPMRVCFRKDSELASLNKISIDDVIKHPIVVSYKVNDTVKYYNQVFGEKRKLKTFIQSQNSDTKKYFITQGLAIAIETDLTLKSDPFYQSDDIITKPIFGIEPKLSFYCLRLKNQHFSAASQKFLKELRVQANKFKE